MQQSSSVVEYEEHAVLVRFTKENVTVVDKATPIMTVEEVAKYLSLHPLTVRRLARDGEIPAFKIGRQWRVKKALLERWIAERSAMKTDAAPEPEE